MTLISAISPDRDANLAMVMVHNDGTGTATRGNYKYEVFGKNDRVLKRGRIENWPRKAKSPIALLERILNELHPEKS